MAGNATPPGTSYAIMAKGVLAVNDQPRQSSWLDMFAAEEVGSIGRLDLGKIQMFYFTVILVFSYAAALASLLASSSGKIDAFPALSRSAIALLGISQTAYLANKAVPRHPYRSAMTPAYHQWPMNRRCVPSPTEALPRAGRITSNFHRLSSRSRMRSDQSSTDDARVPDPSILTPPAGQIWGASWQHQAWMSVCTRSTALSFDKVWSMKAIAVFWSQRG